MYKCSECGTEYEVKPEYCDCGNNVFEEITPEPEVVEVSPKPVPQVVPQKEVKTIKTSKVQVKKPVEKKTFSQQYPELTRLLTSLDPISVTIFLFCILLSVYVVMYVGNPVSVDNEGAQIQTSDTEALKSIPDNIDVFWNNELPKYTAPQPAAEPVAVEENPIQEVVNKVIPKINKSNESALKTKPASKVVSQPWSGTSSVKSTPKTQTKTVPNITSKNTTQTQKTPVKTQTSQIDLNKIVQNTNNIKSQQTVPKAVQKVQPLSKQTSSQNVQKQTTSTQAASQKTSSTPAPVPVAQKTAPTTKQEVITLNSAPTQSQVNNSAQKKELASYKISLRNAIGKKIDFANVVGDGECVVSFKISSTGQLTNKVFSKQSSNITLNNAVYKAVMSTPSFNAPPSLYNNETLSLKVSFYNGNFEISLP